MDHPPHVKMKKLKKKIIAVSLIIVLFIIFSIITYCIIERWNFFDSVYFAFTELMTVGTGDVSPASETTRGFTIFFVVGSILLLIYLVLMIRAYITLRRENKQEKWIEIRHK